MSQWLLKEGESISYGEGGGRRWCRGTSMMIRPEKGLRSVSSVLCSCPLDDSLVSFVIIMLTNKFCPLMISHLCFGWLRSLHFLT